MTDRSLQRELAYKLTPPTNLRMFTSFVLSDAKGRRRQIEKMVRHQRDIKKVDPKDRRGFDPAGRYGPARNALLSFYREPQDLSALRQKAIEIRDRIYEKKTDQARKNCLINYYALLSYIKYFGDRKFITAPKAICLRITNGLSLVRIKPDLCVFEASKPMLIKPRFAKSKLDLRQRLFIKKMLEIIYLAQLNGNYNLPLESVFCMDVSSGTIIECDHPGPHAWDELIKALEYYEQLYFDITEVTKIQSQISPPSYTISPLSFTESSFAQLNLPFHNYPNTNNGIMSLKEL